MLTAASQRALDGLRDLSTLQWYVIPLFAIIHFFVAIIIMLHLKTLRAKITMVASLYAIAAVANIICMGFLGWKY